MPVQARRQLPPAMHLRALLQLAGYGRMSDFFGTSCLKLITYGT
jgi:hypothetical protein